MAVKFLNSIEVASTSAFSNQVTIADSLTNGGSLVVGRKAGQPSIKSSNAFFIIDSSTDFAAINYYVNTNVVLAHGGGNVGVGDNSPSDKLSVSGNIAATGTVTGTNLVTTSGNQTIAGTKTFSSNTVFPGADGGTEIGVWAQSSSYGFIGTAGMTGLEYSMIFDGTNTFVGAGTGGALKLRGPANDSSPSIVIDGSSVTVDDGVTVGTGTIRAKYKSSDNTAGLTSTIAVRNGNNSASLTFTIKDGLITSIASSDRRLKTNITLIGTSDSGINIYTFEYKHKFSLAGVGLFQGVMSDEVPAHAVSVDEHGYDMVDYSLIDVEFKRVSS